MTKAKAKLKKEIVVAEAEIEAEAEVEAEIIAANPAQDGYYWLYDHRRDSVYMMPFRNGVWEDALDEGMEMKEIIEGPMPYPTQEQIDGHQEHFETVRMQRWAATGCDPLWQWGEKLETDRPDFDTNPPAPMMAGFYWLKFDHKELPEIAMAFEHNFLTVGYEELMWDHSQLSPRILFGPLTKPNKLLVKSRVPERARLARAHLPHWCQ